MITDCQIVTGSFQVSEDKVMYTNLLTYNLDAGLPPITELVACVYDL